MMESSTDRGEGSGEEGRRGRKEGGRMAEGWREDGGRMGREEEVKEVRVKCEKGQKGGRTYTFFS